MKQLKTGSIEFNGRTIACFIRKQSRSPDWIKVKSAKFPAMNRPKDAFS